ncbi:MAG: transcriptional regulator [Muribaculaceae bacterium]|nr:transcriptional regulator [Muribaculaceae bacterium]
MILQRLKTYIDNRGISIAAFEKSVGMSNASFSKALKGGGAIGSDKLENILSVYCDISAQWLLTGEGDMLADGRPTHKTSGDPMADKLLDIIAQKDNQITEQAETIGQLKERIRLLEQRLEKTAGSANIATTANVG